MECLKVNPHKGITEQICVGKVGKINIVCGKNNSGKSSFLEAINMADSRVVGFVEFQEFIDRMFDQGLGRTGWYGQGTFRNQLYRSVFENAFSSKSEWYLDESIEFGNVAKMHFQSQSDIRQYSVPAFDDLFKTALSDNSKTVLIPAKRKIETRSTVDSKKNISPNGMGIINALFHWKNQQADSPLWKAYSDIKETFREISEGFQFDLFLVEGSQFELRFCFEGNRWQRADDCGLGLQELLIMLFFIYSSENNICLIEEPENHIHPDMQKRILNFIYKFPNKQFFISTHSNIFVNSSFSDKIFFANYDNGTKVSDETNKALILSDLGYSVTDNLVSDLIILTEGPTDVPVLEELFIKMNYSAKYNIKFWPLGGDIMDKLDLSVFLESYQILAIVDSDPGSRKVRNKFMQKCQQLSIPCHKLSRYSIENYFPIEILRTVFGSQFPDSIESIDPKIKLKDQIGLDVKHNNRKLSKLLDISHIEGTDLKAFVDLVGATLMNRK